MKKPFKYNLRSKPSLLVKAKKPFVEKDRQFANIITQIILRTILKKKTVCNYKKLISS